MSEHIDHGASVKMKDGASFSPIWACDWLCRVEEQTEDGPRDEYFECGATTHFIDRKRYAWECTAGHRHQGIESELEPFGLEWEREQMDRLDGDRMDP